MKKIMLWVAAAAVPVLSAASYAVDPTVKPAAEPGKASALIAQEKASMQPADAPPTDWSDPIKQPCKEFRWGADLRLRHEYHENATALSEDAANNEFSYQRYRARAWYTISPTEELSFNNRWVWEGRYYWSPDTKEGFDNSYVIADQLNVQIRNMANTDTVLTVGRQDMGYADGWLVYDGTPLDGSRTLFFDAVRAEIGMKDIKSKLDLSYLVQRSNADDWSPIIGEDDEAHLTEQNEQGFIANFNNKSFDGLTLDGFLIWKHDDASLANGDNGDIYAVGGRAEKKWGEHWSAKATGAYEFGHKENDVLYPDAGDLQAFGVNSRVSYAFNDPMKNVVNFDFEFLSGDDPSTKTNEAFDVLWGRWPRFSEIFSLLESTETRVADYTNLYRFGPSWQISPTQKLRFDLAYYVLFADEKTYATDAFGDGYFRGHEIQAVLRYQFNRHMAGHLWGEYFLPGGYYADNRQDNAVFLRAELSFTL